MSHCEVRALGTVRKITVARIIQFIALSPFIELSQHEHFLCLHKATGHEFVEIDSCHQFPSVVLDCVATCLLPSVYQCLHNLAEKVIDAKCDETRHRQIILNRCCGVKGIGIVLI